MAALRAIGLMSGTSMDGVDVALIETDGEKVTAFGPSGCRPYLENERALLRQSLKDAAGLASRDQRPGSLADAERLVTAAHATAVEDFLKRHAIARESVDVVGFHGQTVLHRPERRLTVQIGDGVALARKLGMAVVYDLRAADVDAGGQGAPLVPVFHRALVRARDPDQPVCVVNIGGVSNISYVDGDVLVACDTGPGNALLDDFMLKATGEAVDRDGALAATGRVDENWIRTSLQRPFFAMPPPKSLDRNDFMSLALPSALSPADGAATLSAFTAACIARIVPHLPKPPARWIVAGGGANNPTLVGMLAARLGGGVVVETAAQLGWQGDAIEAQAFAYLAVRSLRRLPQTFPGTTGVPQPVCGGVLAQP